MLTDSVKAALKSVLLPVPLTVMKKPHKRQPAKFYLQHKPDECQVSPAVTHRISKKQRNNHAKQ